jgi:hypothetical protein
MESRIRITTIFCFLLAEDVGVLYTLCKEELQTFVKDLVPKFLQERKTIAKVIRYSANAGKFLYLDPLPPATSLRGTAGVFRSGLSFC